MPRSTKTAAARQLAAVAATDSGPAIGLAAEPATEGEAGGEITARSMPSRDAIAAPERHQSHAAAIDAAREPRQAGREGTSGEPAYAADPNEKITVSLSDSRGGPLMHLLRSHRYKQMQIKFAGTQPDEKQLDMLQNAGWSDRTEKEGVWTKQIDPDSPRRSVFRMEQEFRDIANVKREANGLPPVLEGLEMS
jgi:hypothetical protein